MRWWTTLAVIAALAAGLHPVPIDAQTSEAVGVVTTIDGRVTVARPAIPAPLSLKFKDDVFGRDKISTQENALVRVLLGGKAILTVRELSQVTISEEPGRAVVTLPDGKVVLAVAKQRMRPGESIEIHTPNAVAAVRGSMLSVGFDAIQQVTSAICHIGDCLYGFAGAALGQLPPGMGAKNNQIAPAQVAEQAEALAIRTGTRTISSPPESLENSIFQSQTSQARQVAEFVNTGSVFRTGGITSTTPGTPTVQVAPNNALTGVTHQEILSTGPQSTGNGGGGTGGTGGGTGGGGGIKGPNLLVNGGFESGDFSGWTQGGNFQPSSVVGLSQANTIGSPSIPGFFVHSGSFGAFLGPITQNGTLSQTFPTVAQQSYIVSFFLRSDGGLTNSFAASWAGQTIFSQTNIPFGNWMPLSFTEVAPGSSTTLQVAFHDDPGFLALDDVSVNLDPPRYFVGSGNTLTRAGSDPLLRLTGTPQTFDSLMIVCCGGQVRLGGPLFQATNSDLTVPFSLVSVIQGGSLVSSTPDPLVQLQGGTHTFGVSIGLPMFEIAGVNSATDPATGLTLGTDRPLKTGGALIETSGAMVNTYQAARVDNALLEATAPLLALRNGSQFTTAADAVHLSYQAQVTSLGPLAAIDRSILTVANGAAVNLAGGSVLRVAGNLFSLANGSTLQVLNGPLVSLSGGSVLSVTGALIAFGGTGGNLVSMSNGLCPCATIGGIPVSLSGGALASNVSISGAIKSGSLGALKLTPNAAVLSVNGATTKVTIKGL